MKLIKLVLPPAVYRKRSIRRSMEKQQRIADEWNPVIDDYFDGKIEKFSFTPKKNLGEKKIIWQYWSAGVETNAIPELINLCFASVDKHKNDYEIIRLSDENISEYVDIPDFVFEKRKNNSSFKIAFFSDLLRLILLKTYGGVWLDATIFLSAPLPQEYAKMDYFMFQRSSDELHKNYWEKIYPDYFCWAPNFKVNLLNSVIFGKPSSEVLGSLLDVMLCFWKRSEKFSYYFTFQVIYNEIITRKLSHLQCPVVNDCTPHIIQKKLRNGYPFASYEQATKLSPIHKMSYFNKRQLKVLKANLGNLHLL